MMNDDPNYVQDRTSSIGSDDPVIILNPTQYTLQIDEDEIMEVEREKMVPSLNYNRNSEISDY